MLLGSPKNYFFVNRYCGMSAVGDVYCHPEMMMKGSSSKVNVTATTTTTGRCREIHVRYVNKTKLPWAVDQIEHKKKKTHIKLACKLWCKSGEVYPNYCRFYKLFKANLHNANHKTCERKHTPIGSSHISTKAIYHNRHRTSLQIVSVFISNCSPDVLGHDDKRSSQAQLSIKRRHRAEPSRTHVTDRTKPFASSCHFVFCSSLSPVTLALFVVRAPEAAERRVQASQQSYWSISLHPPLSPTTLLTATHTLPFSLSLPPSPSVQASLCFWQLLLTIVDVIANFCENWHIWQLKCHMPYRIFFGRFPHLYNRWIRYKSGSLLIHSFPFFTPHPSLHVQFPLSFFFPPCFFFSPPPFLLDPFDAYEDGDDKLI